MQVCLDISHEKTKEREISALTQAMVRFSCKEGYIITFDDEFDLQTEAGVVHVLPAWKWFLGA